MPDLFKVRHGGEELVGLGVPPEEERAGRSALEWLCAKTGLSRYMINTRNLIVFNMRFQTAPSSAPPPWEKTTGL